MLLFKCHLKLPLIDTFSTECLVSFIEWARYKISKSRGNSQTVKNSQSRIAHRHINIQTYYGVKSVKQNIIHNYIFVHLAPGNLARTIQMFTNEKFLNKFFVTKIVVLRLNK